LGKQGKPESLDSPPSKEAKIKLRRSNRRKPESRLDGEQLFYRVKKRFFGGGKNLSRKRGERSLVKSMDGEESGEASLRFRVVKEKVGGYARRKNVFVSERHFEGPPIRVGCGSPTS